MWFSFSTNFLIFITAVILYFFYKKSFVFVYYKAFVILTGFAALVAGFGHLPTFDNSTSLMILYVSRVINLISVFCFIHGTLWSFNYFQHKIYWSLEVLFFLGFLVWLTVYNVFTLVIVYSIFGFIVVGVTSYLLNYKVQREAANRVLSGVFILAVSAIIFVVFKTDYNTLAADIDHVLVSIALVVLMAGFNKLSKNEIKK